MRARWYLLLLRPYKADRPNCQSSLKAPPSTFSRIFALQPFISVGNMMYNPLFIILFVASLSLAIQPNSRVLLNAIVARQPFSLNPRIAPNALLARQSCSSSGEATCEQSCMPVGSVCCDDGSSTYCPNSDYCVPGGCCPDGETCDGSGGGTLTLESPEPTSVTPPSATVSLVSGGSGSCSSSGQATCEKSCMPIDAVCCDDGSSTYCPNGEYCVPNGCCPTGETCDGVGGGTLTLGGSAPTSTSEDSILAPTKTASSSFGSHASSTRKASATTTLELGSESSSNSQASATATSPLSSGSSSNQQQSTNSVSQSRDLNMKVIALGAVGVVAGYLFVQ